jgi:hypothetical protein
LHGRKIRSQKKKPWISTVQELEEEPQLKSNNEKKNPLEIGSFKPQKKRNSPAIKQANKQKIRLNKQNRRRRKLRNRA